MHKHTSRLLLVVLTFSVFGSVTAFAQQEVPAEKRALISEFRVLTGANNVNSRINFSAESVNKMLSAIVNEDKELTESQRADLAAPITEATTRIDKAVRVFLDDKPLLVELSEQTIFVIYDKAFTESELKELIAFYQTPTGKKAAVFLPTLSSQVQTAFGEVIKAKLDGILQPKIQTETEQLKQKIAAMKARKNPD